MIKKCKYCNNKFNVENPQISNVQFCSDECRNNKRRLQRKEYNKRVRQRNPKKFKKYALNYNRKRNQTPEGVYAISFKRALKKGLDISPKDDFISWYTNKEKTCCYCGIRQEYLKMLNWGHGKRMFRLEIERLDNNKGYTIDNTDLACSVCNSVKTSFFSEDEMKVIGVDIRRIWKKRKRNR